MTTPNVSCHLTVLAEREPSRVAIHFPREKTSLTFSELNARVDALAHGLTSIGVKFGTRVALMVPPSLDFFALTFALFKVAAVPVFIDPGMGVKNLGICLGEAEPEAFIGIPKAHLARRLLRWGRATIRTTVNVSRRRFFCTRSLHELLTIGTPQGKYNPPAVSATDSAAILFTSGSTGVAKGAEYTHGIFTAQVEMLKNEYGIQPGEVDLCTFPLFALFGPALGMTCVIPDMDFSRPAKVNPNVIRQHMHDFQVTNMFGSPAVLRECASLGSQTGFRKMSGPVPQRDAEGVFRDRPPVFPMLRRVISAGAPANAREIELFARLLPFGVPVYTPYGATEALPVANISSQEILTKTRTLTEQGKGVCIGRPFAGMTVRVIRISDEPIAEWSEELCVPDGEVGEFVVRGPVVTKSYYNRDVATKLAKIHDPKTGEVLHRMGDVGYRDEHGRLWFCGRKSHRVVTPHGTLFTDMVEPILNAKGGIEGTALVGVTREGRTYPVVCFRLSFMFPEEQARSNLRIATEQFDSTRQIETFLKYNKPNFPVDVRHNSKIFREKLAVWADQQLGPKWKGGPV